MIKRLSSAPNKKAKKASVSLRSKSKNARRIVKRKISNKAGKEDESTLAAEQIFLIYDAVEAKHAKA